MRRWARAVGPLLALVAIALTIPAIPSAAAPDPGVAPQSVRSGAPPAAAVPIPTNANAQSLVARAAAGTAFLITAGVHSAFSVVPKSHDTFYSAPGAVLDGLSAVPSAFREVRSSPALGVAIIGASAGSPLVIRHYGSAAAAQVAAVQPLAGNLVPVDSAWWLQWLDVENNAARGISLTSGMTILHCTINGNGRLGVGGGGTHIVIDGNTISENGLGVARTGFEAGGIKTVGSDVTITDNRITGNGAPGIWTDDDSTGDVLISNTVDNNTVGIEIEISSGATVSHNTLMDNSLQAILVVASSQVVISNNLLNENRAGILVGGAFRTGPNGVHLQAVAVRSNQVFDSGVTGLHQPVPASAGISFDRDRFVEGRFQWQGKSVTFAQWQAAGQERRGSWVP